MQCVTKADASRVCQINCVSRADYSTHPTIHSYIDSLCFPQNIRLKRMQPETRCGCSPFKKAIESSIQTLCDTRVGMLFLFIILFSRLLHLPYCFICLTSSITPCTTNRPVPPAFPWQVDSVTISGLPCVNASWYPLKSDFRSIIFR